MPKSPKRSRGWATSLALALLLASSLVRAADPSTQAYTLNGQAGVWFPAVKATQLLEDVAQLPAIKVQLEKLEQRLAMEKERATLLERNVQTTEKIAGSWKATAESQAALLTGKDPWWKSPYLWLTVGIVVGTATTIGIAHAVKEIN